MQKDEEVGKVAQATPIVICAFISNYFASINDEYYVQPRHWSYFLPLLLKSPTKSQRAEVPERSKHIICASNVSTWLQLLTVYRKHAVETTEMLDFLKEIVEGVPDPSAGGTIDVGDAEGKKKRGKARKAEGPELLAPRKKRKKPEEDVVMAEQSEPEQDEDNKQEAAVSRSRSAEDDDEDSYD